MDFGQTNIARDYLHMKMRLKRSFELDDGKGFNTQTTFTGEIEQATPMM
jgi:hypothetical protein